MATIDKIVLKENNITTSYDIAVKGENVSGTVASAESANKLTSDAGSATQPVYFSDGKPVACTYTLGASVPAGAKFTDTTYSAATQSAAGLMSAADKTKLDGITASADSVSFTRNLTSGTKIGTITINGGTITGKFWISSGSVTITGGTFNFDPSEYVDLEKYTVTENEGVYIVTAK